MGICGSNEQADFDDIDVRPGAKSPADAFVEEARKADRNDDKLRCWKRAAKEYIISGQHARAGDCFKGAGIVYYKAGSKCEAANMYREAAKTYARNDMPAALELYKFAADYYSEDGKKDKTAETYDEAIVTAEQQYASLGESADMTPLINFMKVAISKYEAASQKDKSKMLHERMVKYLVCANKFAEASEEMEKKLHDEAATDFEMQDHVICARICKVIVARIAAAASPGGDWKDCESCQDRLVKEHPCYEKSRNKKDKYIEHVEFLLKSFSLGDEDTFDDEIRWVDDGNDQVMDVCISAVKGFFTPQQKSSGKAAKPVISESDTLDLDKVDVDLR